MNFLRIRIKTTLAKKAKKQSESQETTVARVFVYGPFH